jgi:formate/nitrite transporter FocA (FNT family)
MKRFIRWMNNIHSTGKPESAKRFYGAVGFIVSIIYIAIWRHDLCGELMYVSAALLGLETITKILKRENANNKP